MDTKKVILISGGNDGLGKALASLLAPSSHVVILGRNKEKCQEVAVVLEMREGQGKFLLDNGYIT